MVIADEREVTWQDLVTGWQWMKRNPDHPEIQSFFDRWLTKLTDFTGRFGMIGEDGSVVAPHVSLWRQGVAEQLGLNVELPEATIPGPRASKSKRPPKYISDRS